MRGAAIGKRACIRGLLPAAALGLGLLGVVAPQAAHAQFWSGWGGGWGELDRQGIRQSIAQQGFRVIAPLRRNGEIFVADVLDPQGQRERLIVAPTNGQILQRFYLDDPRLPGRVPRSARGLPRDPNEAPTDGADRADLVPPADIPDRGGRGYGDPAYQAPTSPGAHIVGRGSDEDLIQPPPAHPPLKTVKPKPRVVERSPDTVRPDTPITRRPLDAPAPPAARSTPPSPGPATASAPPPPAASTPSPAAAPSPPVAAPPPSTTTRLRDPLAIPGGEPKPKPAVDAADRAVPGVTGGPVQTVPADRPRPAQKPTDVPAAPLD